MLSLFNATLPDGLWLLEVKQANPAVQIEGRALSQTAVSDFAKALQDSGFFKMPVEIITTLMETVEDTSVFRFVLKAEPVAGDPTKPVKKAVAAPAPAAPAAPASPAPAQPTAATPATVQAAPATATAGKSGV
jgi:Tfp pilus assembly protein PilN